jgi:hypothetical protein
MSFMLQRVEMILCFIANFWLPIYISISKHNMCYLSEVLESIYIRKMILELIIFIFA